jgi:hypothetical protein
VIADPGQWRVLGCATKDRHIKMLRMFAANVNAAALDA